MIPYDISVYMQRTKSFKYKELQRDNVTMEIIILIYFYMKLYLKHKHDCIILPWTEFRNVSLKNC